MKQPSCWFIGSSWREKREEREREREKRSCSVELMADYVWYTHTHRHTRRHTHTHAGLHHLFLSVSLSIRTRKRVHLNWTVTGLLTPKFIMRALTCHSIIVLLWAVFIFISIAAASRRHGGRYLIHWLFTHSTYSFISGSYFGKMCSLSSMTSRPCWLHQRWCTPVSTQRNKQSKA